MEIQAKSASRSYVVPRGVMAGLAMGAIVIGQTNVGGTGAEGEMLSTLKSGGQTVEGAKGSVLWA